MSRTLEDFFDFYPKKSKSNFIDYLMHKKEFYELINLKNSYSDKLFKHQEVMGRYITPDGVSEDSMINVGTNYNRILLNHDVGTGKTRSAFRISENFLQNKNFGKTLILTKSKNNQMAFKTEFKKYLPSLAKKEGVVVKYSSAHGRHIAETKKFDKFYEMHNFVEFSNKLEKMTAEEWNKKYSNRLIIVDEAHNLRTIKKGRGQKDSKKIYSVINRFLHSLDNVYIVLLTATPMVNDPLEIASIINLLLDWDDQIDIKKLQNLMKTDINEDTEIGAFNQDLYNYLNPKFKGIVSYIPKKGSVPKRIYMGKDINVFNMKMNIKINIMSEFQRESYMEAEEGTRGSNNEKKNTQFYLKPRLRSLFSFPYIDENGDFQADADYIGHDYKRAKYEDLLDKNKYEFNTKAKLFFKKKENFKKCSIVYYNCIQYLLSNEGKKECTYIYNMFVRGPGIKLFGLFMKLYGYEYYTGNESTLSTNFIGTMKTKRFSIIDSETTDNALENIINSSNMPENKYGEYLHVIIGSDASKESLSFRNVRTVMLSAGWNMGSEIQTLGRAERADSQLNFPKDERYIKIFRNAAVQGTDENSLEDSIDIYLYAMQNAKDLEINVVQDIIIQSSFDRYINNPDYKYKKLEDRELDYTTYIGKYDKEKYKEIVNDIKILFLYNSKLTTHNIFNLMPKENKEMIIYTLNKLITSNEIFKNRFGKSMYLRNESDIYYLQSDNVIGINDYGNVYNYSKYLISQSKISLDTYNIPKQQNSAKKFIKSIEKESIEGFIHKFMKLSMMEKVIVFENMYLLGEDSKFINALLKITKNSWFHFPEDDIIIHILSKNKENYPYTGNVTELSDKATLRILYYNQENPKWNNIENEIKLSYLVTINKKLVEEERKISKKHNIYGIYTIIDNTLRLRDASVKCKLKVNGTKDKRTACRGFKIVKELEKTATYTYRLGMKPKKISDDDIKTITNDLKSKKMLYKSKMSDEEKRTIHSWYFNHKSDLKESIFKVLKEKNAIYYR
jgi:DNA-directed RNA polymerase subunit F